MYTSLNKSKASLTLNRIFTLVKHDVPNLQRVETSIGLKRRSRKKQSGWALQMAHRFSNGSRINTPAIQLQ